jgi:hypothetical protein
MDESELTASAPEEFFERELRLGHHQNLVPQLRQAVEAEPLRERRSRQLMLALYRCREKVEALREFWRLRETLGDVGFEPSVETLELERAIMLPATRAGMDWSGLNRPLTLAAPHGSGFRVEGESPNARSVGQFGPSVVVLVTAACDALR